jgi:LuxR family maltose regulon positive regulatory protein
LAGHGILVSAPAGYGKSALVSHWAELRPESCAWLSLDDSDSDLRTFLKYLVNAVRTAILDGCPETQALLQAADLRPIAILAGRLANE